MKFVRKGTVIKTWKLQRAVWGLLSLKPPPTFVTKNKFEKAVYYVTTYNKNEINGIKNYNANKK
jgi:hypothetical protein